VPRLSVTLSAVLRLALATAVLSAVVVLAGGSAVWRLEGERPGSTFHSWGDGIWWALTTMTTVGYGDHVPETTPGRFVAAWIMIMGVAVLGAVAAVVALIFASAVASREERILQAEGRTLEAHLEARLDALDARLAGIEDRLERRTAEGGPRGGKGPSGVEGGRGAAARERGDRSSGS
jgi:voltage-gated potassium channel Kch